MLSYPMPLIALSALMVSLAIGLFLFLKPALAIEIQKRFYAKINWNIEPISMPKEIRNTRIMGLFLILLGAGAGIKSIIVKKYLAKLL